ncbi:MAG TPA: tRNA pseudouridine(55) synthase TruB [Stenomitos sp.]
MLGFINLNKPEGWTSHDCVARVRRILSTKRVGHGGTLDPSATGVLPIAVGTATRLLQFLPTAKAYRATIRLGVQTTTDDLAGDVLETKSAAAVDLSQIMDILPSFEGQINQIPPIYSAIQVNGQRLYKLARQGETVQPEPRKVEIYQIKVIDWRIDHPDHPELTLQIDCGPGTYIRSIARDLGELLHTGATLACLVRTHSCGLDLRDSISLEDLAQQALQNHVQLIPPAQVLTHLPKLPLAEGLARRWVQGQAIALFPPVADEWVQVQDDSARLLGVAHVLEGRLQPKVVLDGLS